MAKERLTKPKTIVEAWARMRGFHRRSFTQAAPLIGLSARALQERNQGAIQVSRTERLAMTAALLDLPEFSGAMYALPPERLEAAKAAAIVIRRALAGEAPEISAPQPGHDPAAQQAPGGHPSASAPA